MDPFRELFDRMLRGDTPFQKDFPCPNCGGVAHSAASESRVNLNQVNISAWCDGCPAELAACGVVKWPGWKTIQNQSDDL